MDELDAYLISHWICKELLPRLPPQHNPRAVLELLRHAVLGVPMRADALGLLDASLVDTLKKLCGPDHRIWEVLVVHNNPQGNPGPRSS